MKNYIQLSFCFVFIAVYADQSVSIAPVTARAHTKMGIVIGLTTHKQSVRHIADVLKNDLQWTEQFVVHIRTIEPVLKTTDITQWQETGAFVVYIDVDGKGYAWRLYDTENARMLAGKRVESDANIRALGHYIADQLWSELTGAVPFFSSYIVYGKEVAHRGRHCKRHLYMRDCTDTTGETERLLVHTPTVNICPRWSSNMQRPLVLYSEFTKTNVRLVSVDMQGNRSIVSNFDGMNMQVAYAPDGKSVVYCLSRAPYESCVPHTTSQLYYYGQDSAGKVICKRLTGAGNNFSPCWGPKNTLFYSSDMGKLGHPNIYQYDLASGKSTPMTHDAYATSPCYSAATDKLAYTKMLNGVMQVFVYDLRTGVHSQLTTDAYNKDDCSWSPCGTLLAYTVEHKNKGRIAVYNTKTRVERFLTSAHEDCAYPAWSGIIAPGMIR